MGFPVGLLKTLNLKTIRSICLLTNNTILRREKTITDCIIICKMSTCSILSPPTCVREKMRTAGVIIIGDEILKGDVKDENTHFLCKRFHALGVRVVKVSVVSDTLKSIADEVKKFSDNYDIVVTAGGIGPTHDDVTYAGIAQAFNEEMVSSDILMEFWKRFYPETDKTGDENPAIKMSKIPKSGRIVHGDLVTTRKFKFPFVVISNIYVFPGIPTYLRAGFSALEKDHFQGWSTKFYDKTLFLNVHESHAITALNQTSKEFSKTVKIGSYPEVNNPYYLTKLTFESVDQEQVESAYKSLVKQLNPEWIENEADFLGNSPDHLKTFIETTNDERFSHLIKHAHQVIAKCFQSYKNEEIFLCFNGGKDCTALLHLVHCYLMETRKTNEKQRVQVLYIRCKDSFQETEDFITETSQRYNLDMTVVDGPLKSSLEKLISGEKSFWKAVLMGTRRTDPHSDKLQAFQETDPGWPKLMRVSPFLDWSYQDIWKFLIKLNIPYCSLYNKGYTSLGSRHNTLPNPDLAYEENGVTKYRPAYALENSHSERNGRC